MKDVNKSLKQFTENFWDTFEVFSVFVTVFGIPTLVVILTFFAPYQLLGILAVYLFSLAISLWIRKDYQEAKKQKRKERLSKEVET